MSKRVVRILYWVVTILFVVSLSWSAVMYFIEAPRMMATMTHLGYPVYFTKILGTAKILGSIALLFPRFPRLKEWAYAGFTFDLIGAFCSHLASGDPLYIALVPAAHLVLLATSYVCLRHLEVGRKVEA